MYVYIYMYSNSEAVTKIQFSGSSESGADHLHVSIFNSGSNLLRVHSWEPLWDTFEEKSLEDSHKVS